ncbi:DHA2 family efflux MFS transporter permease subunit [Amnibacterium sp.]|uniref:DHA2 family efflux MFS transporter permease subunit n=1 Tax=Amnibacterium sp. TaxID=1872496 RepID=UPI003F7BA938
MILIDSTIVSVANPAILRGLHTDIDSVIWATSAYLLAFAVPLLITGRLGDRFGPKRLYLAGLVIFTLASFWCGFAGSIGALIAARAVQGFGGSLISPQSMAVITRIVPPEKRGAALGLWGATAGVATLVGPIAGGLLVDGLGWEWIFFVNVPIGVIGFVLALRFVPNLPTHPHRFDLLGVLLSAVGLFLLVFGLQEGETYDWGVIAGPISVWGLIVTGAVVLVAFVVQQRFTRQEPLVPLELFRDRNFSLANIAISALGFTVTTFSLPLVFFFQVVRGMTPTQSALMLAPMAVVNIGLAPVVGRLVDRVHPRLLAVSGLVLFSVATFLYAALLDPAVPWGVLLLPSVVLGLANALTWSPVSSTATRGLPQRQAGAGSGIYNTTRQIGGVIGSAAIAVLIQARLAADLPGGETGTGGLSFAGRLPSALQAGFTHAMAQSLLLPAIVVLVGAVAVAFFVRPRAAAWSAPQHQAPAAPTGVTSGA